MELKGLVKGHHLVAVTIDANGMKVDGGVTCATGAELHAYLKGFEAGAKEGAAAKLVELKQRAQEWGATYGDKTGGEGGKAALDNVLYPQRPTQPR